MAVVAAACFSGLVVVTRQFIHRIDPVSVNALRLWIAVGFWFLLNPIPDWSRIPREQIIYAAIAAIAGPFLGRLALMISSRYLEARMTALAMLSTPVMTLLLAFVWIADWPAPHELLGGAIMMVGIAIPLLRVHATANSKGFEKSL